MNHLTLESMNNLQQFLDSEPIKASIRSLVVPTEDVTWLQEVANKHFKSEPTGNYLKLDDGFKYSTLITFPLKRIISFLKDCDKQLNSYECIVYGEYKKTPFAIPMRSAEINATDLLVEIYRQLSIKPKKK